MLELGEVAVIARQMQTELSGKRIESAVCGASPHKFAFLNRPADSYGPLMAGHTIGSIQADGSLSTLTLEPGWKLLLGEMGGRVTYHRTPATIPAKHQLLLYFSDGSALTVSIVLWGCIMLFPEGERAHPMITTIKRRPSPMSDDFTFERFEQLLADPEERATKSVKAFMISKPGMRGLGNGSLQDILFNARIHPRRRIVDLSAQEQRALYDATRATLANIIAQGGRESERDLYGRPGGYSCIVCNDTVGVCCPRCGTAIAKIAFLGGACYVCPSCQV